MKKFNVSTLENQVEKLRTLVEKREESFSDKSDKWQESEKGELFQERTDELSSLLDDLEYAVQAIQDWNDNA